ncbi:MAG: nitrous oxide reductase accessory protein NosL [Thermodesulfovibrionales bacterium]|jgi:nitrous oxide reductase accessory protein NosL|nr:nitrous oxide reductase accessory protein NosL [Thermodesulfovibrionales bacterium]
MEKIKASVITINLTIALLLCCSTALFAGEKKPVKPSPKDKCPVCGMFVAKYSDWGAEIIFRDGSYAFFDGAKDMFKYYFNIAKYNPSKNQSDIDSIYVTDYYNLTLINGYNVHYVVGSDVYGPMGRELVPFAKEKDAVGFMNDHKGKKILRFKDITPEVLHTLE